MADSYTYIKKDGSEGTLMAENDAAALSALSGVGDAAPTTGVQRTTAPGGTTGAGDVTGDTTIADAYKHANVPDYTGSEADKTIQQMLEESGRNATAPIDERQIYRDTLKRYQAEIDAQNQIYAEMLAKQQLENKGNLGSSRAIQARSGLLGSDFGAAQTKKVKDENAAAENLIQQEKAAKIAEILGLARNESSAEIAAKRAAQQKGVQDYLDFLASASERKANKLSGLAATILDQGLALEDLDPAQIKEIAKNYGVAEDDIKAAIKSEQKAREDAAAAADLEAKDKLSFTLSEGQAFYEYDPATGGYKQIASRAKTTAGGGGNPGDNPQLYSGLSSATATAVRARVNAYKGEALIQNFGTIQDGYNFASSIATDTKNPADDQALIYSLAKALDPGSVVREGEYATAQKYAQSWVSAYGKGVEQALLGTGFLSNKARENIKKTIEQKYNSAKKSYDQVRSQYITGINSLTGRADGSAFLTDYQTPSTDAGDGGDGTTYKPGDFVEYNGQTYQVGEDGDTLNPI